MYVKVVKRCGILIIIAKICLSWASLFCNVSYLMNPEALIKLTSCYIITIFRQLSNIPLWCFDYLIKFFTIVDIELQNDHQMIYIIEILLWGEFQSEPHLLFTFGYFYGGVQVLPKHNVLYEWFRPLTLVSGYMPLQQHHHLSFITS